MGLRLGITLLRGFGEPLKRLGMVLFHAFPAVVHRAKPELRPGIALIGQRLPYPERCGEIVPVVVVHPCPKVLRPYRADHRAGKAPHHNKPPQRPHGSIQHFVQRCGQRHVSSRLAKRL